MYKLFGGGGLFEKFTFEENSDKNRDYIEKAICYLSLGRKEEAREQIEYIEQFEHNFSDQEKGRAS